MHPQTRYRIPKKISGNPSINQYAAARRPAASDCTAMWSSTQSSLQYKPASVKRILASTAPPATILLKAMSHRQSAENLGTWKVLLQLARPYKKRFLGIALLALLGVGADLLQPLIYRAAINDVAGLFVDRVPQRAGPPAPTTEAQPDHIRDQQLERLEKTQLPHRSDYVAPRTRKQALTTLLWAVGLLFVISVVGYFLSLAADLQSTGVACAIEANLIQATFGHVLRLPLAFFNRRASGGLARRIDQSDQVAPIVSAVARQIAPEVLSIIGICAIMLTESWRLTVAALAILPVYLVITRHAARRLESGMAEYYVMWENVSVRINDALAAIKTVKLSGAETREGDRLRAASQEAYGDFLDRTKLGNHDFSVLGCLYLERVHRGVLPIESISGVDVCLLSVWAHSDRCRPPVFVKHPVLYR